MDKNKKSLTVDEQTYYFFHCMGKLFDSTPAALAKMLITDEINRMRDSAKLRNAAQPPEALQPLINPVDKAAAGKYNSLESFLKENNITHEAKTITTQEDTEPIIVTGATYDVLRYLADVNKMTVSSFIFHLMLDFISNRKNKLIDEHS